MDDPHGADETRGARLAELAGNGSADTSDILGDAIETSEARTLDLGPKLVAALGARAARCKEAEELELPESLEIPRPATLNQVLGYDDYRGYDAEPPKGTRPLFRCESDGQADLNFGDSQDIAFRIADADLAAARFDRVRLWFQTG